MLSGEYKYRLLKFIRDRIDYFFVIMLSILFVGLSLIIEITAWLTIWNVLGVFAVSLFISLFLTSQVLRCEDELWHWQQKERERESEHIDDDYEEAEFSDAKPRPAPDTASDNNIIDAINRIRRRRRKQE